MARLSPPSFKDALLTTAPWALALGFALGAHAGWFCPGHGHSSTTRVEIAAADVGGIDADDPCSRAHREQNAKRIRELQKQVQRVSETHSVPAELVDAIADDPGVFAGQATATLVVRDGEPQGFRIARTKRGSLVRHLGFRDGDVVTHLNGRELKSVDDVMTTVASMRGQEQARVVLLRGGIEVRKRYLIE